MVLKQKLHQYCQFTLNKRLEAIQNSIRDLQNALESETKSSAGDKHETGRAMLQLEREKTGQQLAEIQKLQEVIQKINPESKHTKGALGSVIYTSKSNYFIAISIGEIQIDNTNYYAISPGTPIAKLLLSKQVGDAIEFRDSKFTITEIQ